MTGASPAETIGPNIAAARKTRGKTQGWLADRTGVSQSTLCNVESGYRLPTLQLLVDIATALGCTVTELFKGAEAESDQYRKGFEDGWRAAGNAMHVAIVKGPDVGSLGLGGRS